MPVQEKSGNLLSSPRINPYKQSAWYTKVDTQDGVISVWYVYDITDYKQYSFIMLYY